MSRATSMGAALLVAFLITAAFGASAQASELCRANTADPCAAADVYAVGTLFDANSRAVTITTAGGAINPTWTCGSGDFTVKKTANGARGVDATVDLIGYGFGACVSAAPAGCVLGFNVGLRGGPVGFGAGFNGSLTFNPPPTTNYSCPNAGRMIACTWGGAGILAGAITGAAAATIDYPTVPLAAGGAAGCPTSARFTARYTLIAANRNPTALYITSS